jgi:hypothetical protein
MKRLLHIALVVFCDSHGSTSKSVMTADGLKLILEVKSTTRILNTTYDPSAQRDAIVNPVAGFISIMV